VYVEGEVMNDFTKRQIFCMLLGRAAFLLFTFLVGMLLIGFLGKIAV
jgi:hypothetical protein